MSELRNDALTILVVDDSEDVRTTLALWLRRRGYRVVEAVDGKEAVAAAERELPALILMDIGIGPQSGIASVAQIRTHPKLRDIPIVAVTAYDSPGLRLEADKVGFTEYVTKPFDPDHLGTLIEQLLGQSRGQK